MWALIPVSLTPLVVFGLSDNASVGLQAEIQLMFTPDATPDPKHGSLFTVGVDVGGVFPSTLTLDTPRRREMPFTPVRTSVSQYSMGIFSCAYHEPFFGCAVTRLAGLVA